MHLRKKTFSVFAAALLLSQAAAPVLAQQTGQAESRIQVTTELVLVNVVAHDKKGNLVRDLKKGDFTLFEDGKKQEISTLDRKSTRLNSSHQIISYAVFCLKKKIPSSPH